jgi:hypothetical protein
MTATLPSTTARRLATLSTYVLTIPYVSLFVMRMIGVPGPNPHGAPMTAFTCVLTVNFGFLIWAFGRKHAGAFFSVAGAAGLILVIVGLV